jgi:predicted RNA methylase|uniref:Trimethylguanosine synthase n=1 Tax=viral metagenome TaxID=1070528 RepID=A0A6C0ISF1_9ZZZZ
MYKNRTYFSTRKVQSYNGFLPEHIEKRRQNFVPEVEPKLIPYNEKTWKKMFPKKDNMDYSKLQLSNIGIYSIFYPNSADELAKIIRSYVPNKNAVITDATSNMGGSIFAFAKYFDRINAVEIVKLHCDILENNLRVYDIKDKVDIHCSDYLDVGDKLNQDVIFFDPPWGGKNYKEIKLMNMYLDSVPINQIIKPLLSKSIVAIRVPYNYDFKKILELTPKSYIHSFFRPDGKLSFYLIVLDKVNSK